MIKTPSNTIVYLFKSSSYKNENKKLHETDLAGNEF